jgi:DegV family protein with EDD domain
MTIGIVTDSTCDLPKDLLEKYHITVVPCYINMDGKSYQDGVDLTRQEFYRRLVEKDIHPTTSAPGPGSFLSVYQGLAESGCRAIFSIHISKKFSNVLNSANIAADEMHSIPVWVIDSGNLTLGLGLIVLKAAQACAQDAAPETVSQIISSAVRRTFAWAKLDTIEYLRRGGRMSALQYKLGSLLDIKPILRMNNGVSKLDMVRTKSKAFEHLQQVANKFASQAESFGLTHAVAEDQVIRLIKALKTAHPDLPDPMVSETTPVLGTHVGPGTVCFVWMQKEKMTLPAEKGWDN